MPKFAKFLFAGFLNTIFGYAVYVIFAGVSPSYKIALAMSSILGVIFNYFSFGKIVFSERLKKRPIIFVMTYVGLYILNLNLLDQLFLQGLNKYSAQALLIIPMALISYALLNKLVFR